MDFLERFVNANLELIRDHDAKVRIGKKTRRVIPDPLFRETTRIMSKMRDIFQNVTITPVSASNEYSMAAYYSELSSYDRSMHDSRRVFDQPGFMYERVFPIVATAQDAVSLQGVVPLADQLIKCLEEAPQRRKWPKCL